MRDTNDTGAGRSLVLPFRVQFASMILILAALFFAWMAVSTMLLFKNPSIPLAVMFGVPAVLFPAAAIAVIREARWASLLLGVAAAWYIAFFAATGLHGYVGYAAAVFLCWFLVEFNRYDKRKRASQRGAIPTRQSCSR